MGQEIIEVKDFSFSEKGDGFLRLTAEDADGNTTSAYVRLQNSSGYTADAS